MTEYTQIALLGKADGPAGFPGKCPTGSPCRDLCADWWPSLQRDSQTELASTEIMWIDPHAVHVTPAPPGRRSTTYLAPEAVAVAQHLASGGIVAHLDCDGAEHPIIEAIKRWGADLEEATRPLSACAETCAWVTMYRLRHPSSAADPRWWPAR